MVIRMKEAKEEIAERTKKLAKDGIKPQVDIWTVKGEEGKHYRWINTKKENLAFKKYRLGYEIVQGDESKKVESFGFNSTNNIHQIGDMILAFKPQEDYEKKINEYQDKQDRIQSETKDRYRDEVNRIGKKDFHGRVRPL